MGDMEVREMRSGFYWVDNVVFDEYASRLGVNAYAVYTALARFANQASGQCRPSRQKVASCLGVSVDTVDRAVKKLVENNLVRVERVKEGRVWSHNVYFLLGVAAISGQGGRCERPGVAAISGTNNTEIIKTKDAVVDNRATSDVDEIIAWLCMKYREMFEKTERSWSLTASRRDKARARVAERMKLNNGDKRQTARELHLAMMAMKSSPFHMGMNDRGAKYVEWEKNLFRSQEQTEQWIEKGLSIAQKKSAQRELPANDGLSEMKNLRRARNGEKG